MKKWIFAIALFTPQIALADEPIQSKEDYCRYVEKLAGTIMKSKQVGVPLSAIMSKVPDTSKALHRITRSMAMEAYDSPDYQSDEYKYNQQGEFARKWALLCYQATEER